MDVFRLPLFREVTARHLSQGEIRGVVTRPASIALDVRTFIGVSTERGCGRGVRGGRSLHRHTMLF